ncbi:hypothetical protein BH11BAC2_BH11BAC2_25840 [soil metagenome]
MRKLICPLLIAAAFSFASCTDKNNTPQTGNDHVSPDIINNPATASGVTNDDALPKFDFEESTFDFGTINSGAEIVHEYSFKNSGKADLVITQAHGSCGCTSPEYPKDPVKPGESGVIKVTYRSEGQAGQVAKTITLLANTIPNTKVLTISGEVLKGK